MGGLILRIVCLPLDLIHLTADFLRLTVWKGKTVLWKFLAPSRRPPAPCSQYGYGTRKLDGETVRVCSYSGKYVNPFLLKLLCHWVGERAWVEFGEPCVCDRSKQFRISVRRYAAVGLLLLGFWMAVGVAVQRGMAYWTGEAESVAPRATVAPRHAVAIPPRGQDARIPPSAREPSPPVTTTVDRVSVDRTTASAAAP
jgi:hypothetical protein